MTESELFDNVIVVNVDRTNVNDVLPLLLKSIKSSDLVAIDLEMTGLGKRVTRNHNANQRYRIYKDAAETRSVLAMGLAIFQHTQCTVQKALAYHCVVYQLILFETQPFTVEPGALAFLHGHGLDLNSIVLHGIPYTRQVCLLEGVPDHFQSALSVPNRVWSAILESGTSVAVHNGLADLAFLQSHFHAPLPHTLAEFLADLSDLFAEADQRIGESKNWSSAPNGRKDERLDQEHTGDGHSVHDQTQVQVKQDDGEQDSLEVMSFQHKTNSGDRGKLDPEHKQSKQPVLIDSKFVADYILHYPASFLEYLFRRTQRQNWSAAKRAEPHIRLYFVQEHLENPKNAVVDCSIDSSFVRKQFDLNAIEMMCHQFVNHGFCRKAACKLDHNVDLALNLEEIKATKRRLRARKRRTQSVASGTSPQKRDKTEECEGEPSDMEEKSEVLDGVVDANADPDMEAKNASEEQVDDGRAKTSTKSGCHSAGFDAFMTGFSCLFFGRHALRHNQRFDSALHGRLPLSSSDYPLLIRTHQYLKRDPDSAHRQKLGFIHEARTRAANVIPGLKL